MRGDSLRISTLRRWHRSLGAGAAIFVLFMVISGVIINHANRLGLDHHHVAWSVLLDWYGLETTTEINSYRAGDHWLSFAGSRVYLDGTTVASLADPVGAVSIGRMLVVAGGNELLLLDFAGMVIEKIAWSAIGAGAIESIGLLADTGVAIRASGQLWTSDTELLTWHPGGDLTSALNWSSPQVAPRSLLETIARQYQGKGLSLERLLLDLHSGRIFGSIGVLIYDLLALVIGFLAISGLSLWFKNHRNGKRKRRV